MTSDADSLNKPDESDGPLAGDVAGPAPPDVTSAATHENPVDDAPVVEQVPVEDSPPLEALGGENVPADPTEDVQPVVASDAAAEQAEEFGDPSDDAGDTSDDEGDTSAEADDADDDADLRPLDEVQPVSEIVEEDEELAFDWYILKVQVNREDSIRDALVRRVKVAGLDEYFGDVIVPTEDVAEFNKSGKRRIVKKKLYPGYIMVHMSLNDETWFLVRETPGIGDFTGSAGKPTAMDPHEVERIIRTSKDKDEGDTQVRTAIPFKPGDRVRVKEGYFENFEGDVETVDEANGRVTVMINIFGRSTPVELEHWQIEAV